MSIFFISSLIAIRIFTNSLANVFQKKLIGRIDNALLINGFAFFLLSIFLSWRLFFFDFTDYSPYVWLWGAAGGFLGAAGNGMMIQALKSGELSVLGPINAWKPVIGMLGGIFLISEYPSITGLAGLLLIISGSYQILGASENDGFHWRIFLRRDILLRIGALIFTALEAVFIKKVILLSNVEFSFILWCCFGCIFSLSGGFFLSGRQAGIMNLFLNRKIIVQIILLAFCFGAMQYSTNMVFERLDVGASLALFQLSAVVNLYWGWRLFNEGAMRKKIIGTVMTIIGAVMIILFK